MRAVIFGHGARAKGAPDRGISDGARRKRNSIREFDQARKADGRGPIARWRLHDLRRTASTGMGDLGVQPHVIEATLNHVSGFRAGVAGVYNRSSYAAEKRAGARLVGGHVELLVSGQASNIVAERA